MCTSMCMCTSTVLYVLQIRYLLQYSYVLHLLYGCRRTSKKPYRRNCPTYRAPVYYGFIPNLPVIKKLLAGRTNSRANSSFLEVRRHPYVYCKDYKCTVCVCMWQVHGDYSTVRVRVLAALLRELLANTRTSTSTVAIWWIFPLLFLCTFPIYLM